MIRQLKNIEEVVTKLLADYPTNFHVRDKEKKRKKKRGNLMWYPSQGQTKKRD